MNSVIHIQTVGSQFRQRVPLMVLLMHCFLCSALLDYTMELLAIQCINIRLISTAINVSRVFCWREVWSQEKRSSLTENTHNSFWSRARLQEFCPRKTTGNVWVWFLCYREANQPCEELICLLGRHYNCSTHYASNRKSYCLVCCKSSKNWHPKRVWYMHKLLSLRAYAFARTFTDMRILSPRSSKTLSSITFWVDDSSSIQSL